MSACALLLVDDDPDTCASLSDILSDLGCRVDVADDGPATLARSRRQPYGLAVLDYQLPGMGSPPSVRRAGRDPTLDEDGCKNPA
jgi:CheY-like chemotaxis protein